MKLSSSLFLKILSFCLMPIFAVGSFICAFLLYFMVTNLQVYKQEYQDTKPCLSSLSADAGQIDEYYTLFSKQESNPPLSEEGNARMEQLKGNLYPPAGTNTAWVLFSSSGKPILSNIGDLSTTTVGQVSDLTGGHYEQLPIGNRYVVIGLRSDRPVEDIYSHGIETFHIAKQWFAALIIAVVFSSLLFIVLFSFLIAAAGHKQGTEGIALNPIDRSWLEFQLLCLLTFTFLGFWSVLGDDLSLAERSSLLFLSLLGVLIPIFSLVRRAKAGVLYKTSFWYLFLRFCRSVLHHFNLMARVIAILAVYGLFQVLLVFGIIGGSFLAALMWLFCMISVMAILCIAFIQFDRIQKATDAMAHGDLNQVVEENSVSFFRRIAQNLNNTGKAMNIAVEKSMQSERMKTELITNVSHDIKTPLTSIISYVDLLKKADISDPKALEYIDILDRKSRRLGQLMVDLVEASKVTSGNISVDMEMINLGELVKQASGEFESRMEERGIQLVCTLPEEPVSVYADGRHMWRVLDNLFGNAAKYALDGTRVYVEIFDIGDDVILSVKNVSRDPLNIRPDELIERFVRGDTSRHTEGSGLGLSIAQSLMELQHGSMNICIDGDLFKVNLCLKKNPEPEPPAAAKR